MSIDHLAVCDSCGDNAPAEDLEEEWAPPATWITIDFYEHTLKHFCTWECAGVYVTQKIREEALAREAEENNPP